MTSEKGGGIFRHCPHIDESDDAKGIAQILHEGPVYRLTVFQHDMQRGAQNRVSLFRSHNGQMDG
jgi:hypothetical protein